MINIDSQKKIYIFDFDNTISNKDSLVCFTIYSLNKFLFFKYWISVFLLFPFRSKSDLKEMFYSNFKGYSSDNFNSLCLDFMQHKLSKSIKTSFLNFVEKIDENSKLVVVSASIKNYLKPWCDKMGYDLISTELKVENGKLTGKFSSPNCNGYEKVKRIKEKYNLSEYKEIHVFGNSKGDLPMLELGTHKYYKFFK